MAILQVQIQSTTVFAADTSIGGNWSPDTTAGNLLVAILGHNGDPGSYTPPTNWTQIGTTVNNGSTYISFWYIENAAAQSTTQTWTFANSVLSVLEIIEYSGIKTTGALDQNTSNNGNSSSPSTGTINPTDTNALSIGGLAQSVTGTSNISYSAPTNSYSIAGQAESTLVGFPDNNYVSIALLEKIGSLGASTSTGATSTVSSNWAGVIASFLPASGITKTHTTDALLKALDISLTHTTNALLQAVNTSRTHTTNALLAAGASSSSKTHTTNALLQALGTSKTHTTNALLQASGLSKTHTTNALLQASGLNKTHTTNALLAASPAVTVSKTHTTNALLVSPVPVFTGSGNLVFPKPSFAMDGQFFAIYRNSVDFIFPNFEIHGIGFVIPPFDNTPTYQEIRKLNRQLLVGLHGWGSASPDDRIRWDAPQRPTDTQPFPQTVPLSAERLQEERDREQRALANARAREVARNADPTYRRPVYEVPPVVVPQEIPREHQNFSVGSTRPQTIEPVAGIIIQSASLTTPIEVVSESRVDKPAADCAGTNNGSG